MPTSEATQATRSLSISTPLGEDSLLLTRVRGREEISRLFEFELEMLSGDFDISAKKLVGHNVTFRMGTTEEKGRFFNGYVRRFAATTTTRTKKYRVYRAVVVPWLWFLTRTSDCRIFQNQTVPSILERIFLDLGFQDFDTSMLRGAYPERAYCVQYRETDFAFASRLMEEEGIFYFFRHENGKHTLVLADSPTAFGWCEEREIRYRSTDNSDLRDGRILDWQHGYEVRSGRWAHTDYNFTQPNLDLMSPEHTIQKLPGNGKFELYDYPGRYETLDDGKRLARIRMEEEESRYEMVASASTCRTLAPGGKFTLARCDAASENGRAMVITSLEHEAFEPAHYETTEWDGKHGEPIASYGNVFTCVPDTINFRSARITPKARVKGVQTAVVVGPPGEEIYPDKYGRVKVQFHWDREGNRDEKSSCWLRVSQVHAGQGWGEVDLPRVGEEVIVDFLEGDPDRPIITGRVYNASQTPPFALPGEKTRSSGKTNTYKGSGYNEMSKDDTPGAEQIRVNAQHNMDTNVNNNKTLAVAVDRTTDVGNDQTLTIEVDGSLEVGNDATITVGNDATYIVGNDIEISAGISITLKTGASMIHLNQAGVITINGNYVTSAAAANNCTIAPLSLVSGSNLLLQAGAYAFELGGIAHVKGDKEVAIDGSRIEITGDGRTLLKGNPLKLGEKGAPLAEAPKKEEKASGNAEAGAKAGTGSSGGGTGKNNNLGAPSNADAKGSTPVQQAKEPLSCEEQAKRRQGLLDELNNGNTSEGRKDEILDELYEMDRQCPGEDDVMPQKTAPPTDDDKKRQIEFLENQAKKTAAAADLASIMGDEVDAQRLEALADAERLDAARMKGPEELAKTAEAIAARRGTSAACESIFKFGAKAPIAKGVEKPVCGGISEIVEKCVEGELADGTVPDWMIPDMCKKTKK
jgi:type VI secretion system secreted protein VgrG